MSLKDAWREAFPAQSAGRVVEYMLATWNELAARKLYHFSWAQTEPKLTLALKEILKDNAHTVGLQGFWGGEDQSVKLDPATLKPLKGYRTDIIYHSDLEGLSLTFEWKKLKGTSASRKAFYGKEGMGRFLEDDGYAKRQPFGLMVGIIESPRHRKDTQSLMVAMNKDDILALLHMIPDDGGVHLRAPSRELPGLAMFDTQHVRHSGGFSTFTFIHLFVEFPG